MGTVIFVHGTGVRKRSYDATFDIVRKALSARRVNVEVRRCCWGDGYGVKLQGCGASIPDYVTARVVGALPEEDVALWSLLYQDPLYELRLLAAQGGEAGELIPGQAPPWTALQDAVNSLQRDSELQALLDEIGYAGFWNEAYVFVAQSGELSDALQTVGARAADHRRAIADAIIARMIMLAGDEEVPALSSEARDEITHHIVAALGGDAERGIGSWVMRHVKAIAERIGTRYLKRKRGALSDAAYPAAGDILCYVQRGGGIRGFIRKTIDEATEPVTLLAHSLGAIACVDLLAMNAVPKVARLITVGSQAPLLYELDCLPSLRWDEALPEHFPAWLNIYDRHDMLSYIGAAVFKNRVLDVEVDNGQPFPESHSAYWTNPQVWKEIIAFLP